MKALFLSLVVFCLAACDRSVYHKAVKVPPVPTQDVTGNNYTWDLQVVEIDGCEYLAKPGYNDGMITHKGNCKYCAGAPRKAKDVSLEKAAQPAKP